MKKAEEEPMIYLGKEELDYEDIVLLNRINDVVFAGGTVYKKCCICGRKTDEWSHRYNDDGKDEFICFDCENEMN